MEPNDEVGDALRLQEKQLKEEHAAALKIATDEYKLIVTRVIAPRFIRMTAEEHVDPLKNISIWCTIKA